MIPWYYRQAQVSSEDLCWAGSDGGARAQVWDVDGAVGTTAKVGDEADGRQKRASKEKQIEENESVACIMLAEWPVLG